MKMYTLKATEEFIQKYMDNGGEIIELQEGVLGLGLLMLVGEGLKTFIITERYLSEWSSGHTIRGYNKTPKKYLKMLDNLKYEEVI